MSSLRTLFKALAGERGIELDDGELDQLGLDEGEAGGTEIPDVTEVDQALSQELPGHAAGMVEIYLAADSTATAEPVEKDNLMWYPIIREGQWAVRPGTTGKKRRVPLKVVAGHSKNQRREIGLADLKDAFDDEAIQHVTVPSSHNNTVLENQGFVKGMKIVQGTVKSKITKKDQKVAVLMGGYDITEPATKAKMSRGTIANRSAGILYDYVNTETGKTYPAVVEHVALTNKPWITGMVSFGRKLTEGGIETVALSLSDDEPDEQEYTLALSDEAELGDDADFLAAESKDWSKEGSPSWLRQQVNDLLNEARSKKIKAKRDTSGNGAVLYDDYPPHYRCVEAKPGQALISDNWGDDSNFWSAPISVKDGAVELTEFTKWSPLKKAFIPDERPAPPRDKLPLDQSGQGSTGASEPPKTRLALAQEARRQRAQAGSSNDDNTREVVEQQMAGTETTQLSGLSPEAQAAVQAAEERARAADARADRLSEQLSRVAGTVQEGTVEKYVGWLKSDEGLGLNEERGFGGVLAEISQLMLADDGEPALQSDHFADDTNKAGEISFSDGLKRIFGAMHKAQEGKKNLGEQLSEPADADAAATAAAAAANGNGGAPKESGTNASQTATTVPAGKPGAGDGKEGEQLSTEERVTKIAGDSPMLASVIGGVPASAAPAAGSSTGGDA